MEPNYLYQASPEQILMALSARLELIEMDMWRQLLEKQCARPKYTYVQFARQCLQPFGPLLPISAASTAATIGAESPRSGNGLSEVPTRPLASVRRRVGRRTFHSRQFAVPENTQQQQEEEQQQQQQMQANENHQQHQHAAAEEGEQQLYSSLEDETPAPTAPVEPPVVTQLLEEYVVSDWSARATREQHDGYELAGPATDDAEYQRAGERSPVTDAHRSAYAAPQDPSAPVDLSQIAVDLSERDQLRAGLKVSSSSNYDIILCELYDLYTVINTAFDEYFPEYSKYSIYPNSCVYNFLYTTVLCSLYNTLYTKNPVHVQCTVFFIIIMYFHHSCTPYVQYSYIRVHFPIKSYRRCKRLKFDPTVNLQKIRLIEKDFKVRYSAMNLCQQFVYFLEL